MIANCELLPVRRGQVREAVTRMVVLILLSIGSVDSGEVAIAQDQQTLQFTATGVVDSQYYTDGELTDRRTNEFVCYVAKGKYSMFLTASSPKDKNTLSLDCLFDGTNTYFTRRLSTNPVMVVSTLKDGQIFEHQLPKPMRANNNAILEITEGSMPSTENHAVDLVWISLASIADPSPILSMAQMPLTFLGLAYKNHHIQLKAASRTNDASPHFLAWREDYHEGVKFSESHGLLQKLALTGVLSSGYTNSTYSVMGWTNVMGLAFPKQAQLKVFFPTKDTANVECRIGCFIQVDSIKVGDPNAQFTPVIAAKTTVNDRRLDADGVKATPYYLSLDGGLLNASQLVNNPHYLVSPKHADPPVATVIAERRFFLIVFTPLFLAPVVMLWKFRRKRPTN